MDYITLLSLSPRHNWQGNTLLFSGASFDLYILSSTVIIFLGLGWFLLKASVLRITLLSLLLVRLLYKNLSRYITTLVIIVIFVLFAPTAPDSNSGLVFSLPVWQHSSCPSHVSNNHRVHWGAYTHHPAMSFVGFPILCRTGNPSIHKPMAHLSKFGPPHVAKYGPPSAASLNFMVSPLHRLLRPYLQSPLYHLCLIVPSLAVCLACLLWTRQTTLYAPLSLLVDPSVSLFFNFCL